MCPEPRCGRKFKTNPSYRGHWVATHRANSRSRIPRCIRLSATPPTPPLKSTKKRKIIENLNEFKFVSPTPSSDEDREEEEEEDEQDVVERAPESLYRPTETEPDEDEDEEEEEVDNEPVIPNDAVADALLLQRKHKRLKLDNCQADNDIKIQNIVAVQKISKSLQVTLEQITSMDCDEQAKDILRHMALRAVDPTAVTTIRQPAITISNLVREHLGYIPAKVNNGQDPTNKLYIEVGRRARLQYIRYHNKPPPKRLYTDESGNTKEINNYSAADKGWMMDIVSEQCAKLKVYPRPKVAMARGEDIVPLYGHKPV